MNDDINIRLRRVERGYRRLLLVSSACVALLTIALMSGFRSAQRPDERVQARSYELVDANGTKRAALSMTDMGPALQFFNEKDQVTVMLGTSHDGATCELSFLNPAEEPVPRLRLGLIPGGAAMYFCDNRGAPRLQTSVHDDGTASTLFLNERAQAQILHALSGEGPLIVLRDQDGEVIWSAEQGESGDTQEE